MILATFIHNNNKEYIYSIVDNKIEYSYKTDDGICRDITDSERLLMNKFYTKLVISKNTLNHKKCGIVNYNNKKFQIMYDIISQRKFFYEINNNVYTMPTYADFLYLDNKLNPDFLCEEDGKLSDNRFDELKNNLQVGKDNKKNYSRFLIIGSCVLNLFSFASYTIQSINITNSNLENEHVVETETELSEKQNIILTIDDLKQTLSNNICLSSGEKQFILSGFEMLEENVDYVDFELVNERLKDVVFSYHSELYYDEDGTQINGRYTSSNVIIIYGCSSYEEAIEKCYDTMSHERGHLFTSKFTSLGNKINEAMNEIINLEYQGFDLDYTSGSYVLERKAVYLLIELLGPEVLREYYLKNDPQILIDNLINIIDDEEKAYELIGMVDNLSLNYHEKLNNDLTIMGKFQALAEVYDPFNNLLNEYFITKYGYDMMEDEIMQLYVYEQVTVVRDKPNCMVDFELQANEFFEGMISTEYEYVIPYFSKTRIDLYPNSEPKQFIRYYSDDDGSYKELVYYFEADRKNMIKIR